MGQCRDTSAIGQFVHESGHAKVGHPFDGFVGTGRGRHDYGAAAIEAAREYRTTIVDWRHWHSGIGQIHVVRNLGLVFGRRADASHAHGRLSFEFGTIGWHA